MNTADKLFEEVHHLYGRNFVDKHTKKVYTFIGVLVSEDDYYYTMYSPEDGIKYLSCVGSIEMHGYELVDRK